jgi:hypothetical protein
MTQEMRRVHLHGNVSAHRHISLGALLQRKGADSPGQLVVDTANEACTDASHAYTTFSSAG